MRARVNLVGYNPPPGEPGAVGAWRGHLRAFGLEPPAAHPDRELLAARARAWAEARALRYEALVGASVNVDRVKRIVPVGPDVHASCGMFAAEAK